MRGKEKGLHFWGGKYQPKKSWPAREEKRNTGPKRGIKTFVQKGLQKKAIVNRFFHPNVHLTVTEKRSIRGQTQKKKLQNFYDGTQPMTGKYERRGLAEKTICSFC